MQLTRNPLSGALVALAAVLTFACSDSIGPPTPITGAIAVTTSTVGLTPGEEFPTGYQLTMDAGREMPVGFNDKVLIGGVSKGDHIIRLNGLAPNCSVDGTNPRLVAVSSSVVALVVTFNVLCAEKDLSPWDY